MVEEKQTKWKKERKKTEKQNRRRETRSQKKENLPYRSRRGPRRSSQQQPVMSSRSRECTPAQDATEDMITRWTISARWSIQESSTYRRNGLRQESRRGPAIELDHTGGRFGVVVLLGGETFCRNDLHLESRSGHDCGHENIRGPPQIWDDTIRKRPDTAAQTARIPCQTVENIINCTKRRRCQVDGKGLWGCSRVAEPESGSRITLPTERAPQASKLKADGLQRAASREWCLIGIVGFYGFR